MNFKHGHASTDLVQTQVDAWQQLIGSESNNGSKEVAKYRCDLQSGQGSIKRKYNELWIERHITKMMLPSCPDLFSTHCIATLLRVIQILRHFACDDPLFLPGSRSLNMKFTVQKQAKNQVNRNQVSHLVRSIFDTCNGPWPHQCRQP